MFSICCGNSPKIIYLICFALHPKVRHRRLIVPPGKVELPVRVGKEVLCLVDPFINEKDGRSPPLPLVLHKRIAVMVKALRFRIVIVVVVKLPFVPHLSITAPRKAAVSWGAISVSKATLMRRICCMGLVFVVTKRLIRVLLYSGCCFGSLCYRCRSAAKIA